MSSIKERIIDFKIDTYLNPFVPPNQLKHLPTPISHWLGYRTKEPKEPPLVVSQAISAFGTLLGLLVVGAIYKYAPGIDKYHPPVIIAALGASAFLEFNACQTPLSQPRNAILGHLLCAIIGVAITKAFETNSNFQNLTWVAGAVACAVASLVTGLTNTVHPPGGATAVLAATTPSIVAMGWYFVPVLLVGILVMLAVAFLINNLVRQFPMYWWTPDETGQAYKKNKQSDEEEQKHQQEGKENEKDEEKHDDAQSDTTLKHTDSYKGRNGVFVSADQMVLPTHVVLTADESRVLNLLQVKLRGIQAQ